MTDEDIFLHDLCGHLGYKSIRDLKNKMSIRELSSWYEYYQIKPFHADRLEQQMATLSYILAVSNGSDDATPMDFMISVSKEDKEKHANNIKQAKLIEALENF